MTGLDGLPSDSDYRLHLPRVRLWHAVEAFTSAAGWDEGVHVVQLPSGSHVDVLIQGDLGTVEAGRCLLVVLSGAVAQRENARGPFFSGTALARLLGAPVVSISDPLLNVDQRLRLGWYTGQAEEGLQASIRSILQAIGTRTNRELLLCGGSGGGFAALQNALRLDVPVSALVWNPQTDLLEYDPPAVRDYLVAALRLSPERVEAMTRDERVEALARSGIDHRVLPASPAGAGLRRVLYLQNASDGHVSQHLAPLLAADDFRHLGEGRWQGPRGELVLVSAFAQGHGAPPRAVLERAVGSMLEATTPAVAVVDDLQARGLVPTTGLDLLPRDLRAEAAELRERLTLRAERDHLGRLRLAIVWRDRPNRYGGIRTRFAWTGESGRTTTRMHADNVLVVEGPSEGIRSARATVLDGFRNPILTLEAEVVDSARLAVQLVGSCVSRDTFEFLSPDLFELRGYVARQSLVSAFAAPGKQPFDLGMLTSNFQRRMLRADAMSELPARLRRDAGRIDLVVWDLVDERFGLIDHGDGRITTDSVELRAAEVDGQVPVELRRIAYGSEDHFRRFESALVSWRELLIETGLMERTVLLAPPWATHTADGTPTPSSFGVSAQEGNAVACRYLDAVDRIVGVPVVGRTLRSSASHPDHRWGVAPFHYDDDTYLALARELAAAARSLCHPVGWAPLDDAGLIRAPIEKRLSGRSRSDHPEIALTLTGQSELTVTVRANDVQAYAFALHRAEERTEMTPYLRTATHRFVVKRRGVYRCRAFLMTSSGQRLALTSEPVAVVAEGLHS